MQATAADINCTPQPTQLRWVLPRPPPSRTLHFNLPMYTASREIDASPSELGRAVVAADTVVHVATKEALRQVAVLDHGQLEGVTLELGVVVGVDGAPHALDHHCSGKPVGDRQGDSGAQDPQVACQGTAAKLQGSANTMSKAALGDALLVLATQLQLLCSHHSLAKLPVHDAIIPPHRWTDPGSYVTHNAAHHTRQPPPSTGEQLT